MSNEPGNDPIGEIDSLFTETDDYDVLDEVSNIMLIGLNKTKIEIEKYIKNFPGINFKYVENIDEAIELLLREIFAVVILDHQAKDMDVITVSRIVRINHPLARIVVVSNSRRSLFIADIINRGSVDAYLAKPFSNDELYSLITEQVAKHEIDKMLTNFVSQPPKLSEASYLLLDPSLSFQEDEPVRFVGIIISNRTVPRYSKFFEELLAKDEVLFAGYLSGITILGKELLNSKKSLKEINFGGISVIFRFHDDIQLSIFVRNLSKNNYTQTEQTINRLINELIEVGEKYIIRNDRIPEHIIKEIDNITRKFEEANEDVKYEKEEQLSSIKPEMQQILYFGIDEKEHELVKRYLNKRYQYKVKTTADEEDAIEIMDTDNVSVLLLDSGLDEEDEINSLSFADYAKDKIPYIQTIYLMRDRRASSPIINSLNSGAINFLISYRSTRKEMANWISKAIEKAMELKEKSSSGEIKSSLDKATIAKTMIRKNESSYLMGNIPILDGIFVTKDEIPIYSVFWNEDDLSFDENMLAGLVASLDSVSEEVFSEESTIGGLELGDANILVEHREDYNFAFFIENIGTNTSRIIDRELEAYADRIYSVLTDHTGKLQSPELHARIDVCCNSILADFSTEFNGN